MEKTFLDPTPIYQQVTKVLNTLKIMVVPYWNDYFKSSEVNDTKVRLFFKAAINSLPRTSTSKVNHKTFKGELSKYSFIERFAIYLRNRLIDFHQMFFHPLKATSINPEYQTGVVNMFEGMVNHRKTNNDDLDAVAILKRIMELSIGDINYKFLTHQMFVVLTIEKPELIKDELDFLYTTQVKVKPLKFPAQFLRDLEKAVLTRESVDTYLKISTQLSERKAGYEIVRDLNSAAKAAINNCYSFTSAKDIEATTVYDGKILLNEKYARPFEDTSSPTKNSYDTEFTILIILARELSVMRLRIVKFQEFLAKDSSPEFYDKTRDFWERSAVGTIVNNKNVPQGKGRELVSSMDKRSKLNELLKQHKMCETEENKKAKLRPQTRGYSPTTKFTDKYRI
jgi:hypothetical protein